MESDTLLVRNVCYNTLNTFGVMQGLASYTSLGNWVLAANWENCNAPVQEHFFSFKDSRISFSFDQLPQDNFTYYEPPTFWTPSKPHLLSAYSAYKPPESYLSPRHTLYPRSGNPTYCTMEPSQTDISVSWFKFTKNSETNSDSITSFKVGLNSQSNRNFSPCRCV